MSSKLSLIAASLTLAMSALPSLSHAQSFGDLLKLVPQGIANNNVLNAIKSLSEITQGQLEPGTTPENADGKVVLYRTEWCGYCKRAAAYMQSNNVPFIERDIERNAGYKAEFKRLGGKGVPLIVLGEKTMSGFSESAFEKQYASFKQTGQGSAGAPAATLAPNAAIRSGDVLIGKINGINIYTHPTKAEKLIVLGKTDEVIYMGEEREGLYRVTTTKGEGWVDKLLVKKP